MDMTDSVVGKRVAVMQPYFLPYAGYFRLFHEADEFVIFDCVQFPRRGRVHRTEIPGSGAEPAWLTLPLAHQPRETLIRDLSFAPGARAAFDERLERVRWLREGHGPAAARIIEHLYAPLDDVVDYLESGLRLVCELLGLSCDVTRSSSIGIPSSTRGPDRVLAVALARGATRYVNAPGGVGLYDPAAFRQHGIELRFLEPYAGPYRLLLPSLISGDPAAVAADVRATSRILTAG